MFKNLAFFITALFIMTSTAWASLNWDDSEPMTIFLSKHYNIDPIVVVSVGQSMKNYDDDASVALFISKISGTDPIQILKMRIEGKSWMKVMDECAVEPSVLFFDPQTTDLPGRYSYAFRQYDKYKKNHDYKMVLYDGNVRDLVQLRLMKEGFGKNVSDVMKRTSEGTTFTELIMEIIGNDPSYKAPKKFYLDENSDDFEE